MKIFLTLLILIISTEYLESQEFLWNSVDKHYDIMEPLAISDDGDKVIFRSRKIDGELMLQMFDVKSGKQLWSLGKDMNARFSRDGEKIIIYNTETMEIFNVETG